MQPAVRTTLIRTEPAPGVSVLLHWCYSIVTVVLQLFYNCVTVVLPLC
jgi:hypothetical protein